MPISISIYWTQNKNVHQLKCLQVVLMENGWYSCRLVFYFVIVREEIFAYKKRKFFKLNFAICQPVIIEQQNFRNNFYENTCSGLSIHKWYSDLKQGYTFRINLSLFSTVVPTSIFSIEGYTSVNKNQEQIWQKLDYKLSESNCIFFIVNSSACPFTLVTLHSFNRMHCSVIFLQSVILHNSSNNNPLAKQLIEG